MVDPSIITITEKAEGWTFSKMHRFCEETQMYGKAPGGGSPLVIEAPLTSYPRPEIPLCGEEERNYQIGEAAWVWAGPIDFSAVEFDNVSFSATAEPENGEAVRWLFVSCSAAAAGFNSKPPSPTVVVETPDCKSENENSVVVEMFVGEVQEIKPVTVSASLSIGAILLHEAWFLPEESETYGTENESEPERKPCMEGGPVNCATGNQVVKQTDLRVGGHGPGLDLTRTYNSRLAFTQTKKGGYGPFGYGWTGPDSTSLEIIFKCKLVCLEKYAKIKQDNGSTVRFERNGEKWEPEGPLVQASLGEEEIGEEEFYVYALPDQSKLKFKHAGELLSESDRNGNTITMGRGSGGRLETITDYAGRKVIFTYNSEGFIGSAKDPMGDTVKYTYEGGNLVSVTEPGESGPRWRFKYNAQHEITAETDGRGNTLTTEYDGSGRAISQTDPLKRTFKWAYTGKAGRENTETFITEPNGSVTRDAFDLQDQPTSTTRAYGTSYGAGTTYEYDGLFNLKAVTDPRGYKTSYTYDAAGDRTSEKNPDGEQTKWVYDGTRDVVKVTNPNGETMTIVRDAHGNALSVSRPAPGKSTQTTSYGYDAHGNPTKMVDPLNHAWSYEYDNQGNRTSEIDPEGDKRTFAYNEDSQETSMVSPDGNAKGAEPSQYTTKTERDAQGRPTTITDPLGHTNKYLYDANGNIESETDANGHTTTYTYDADNEPIEVKEPNGASTETAYDAAGQVISQTDADKHTTTYTRNLLEEATETTDPLGRVTVKEYNPDGDLGVVRGVENEHYTSYSYDPADRLIHIYYLDEEPADVTYEYDAGGNRTKMIDGTGETGYSFDKLDRLVQSTDGHGDNTGYEYDLNGNQTKLTYPNGHQITRAYDSAGRLKSVTDWNSNTTTFTYDPNSNLTTTTFPSATGEQDKTTYNDANQVMKITMAGNGLKVLASLAYTRDSDGQLKATQTKGLPGEENTGYTYDSNNRLIKAGTTVYGYDPANNPTKLGASTYTYDPADQLKTGTGVKYTYNEVGQRTMSAPKGAATTYGYDQAGDLIALERPAEGKVPQIKDTYTYNGDGLRASQTISGATTYLAWDVAEGPPMLLSDGTNSYIYGPEGQPVEQVNNTTGTTVYLHHDQQGSTRLITGKTGKSEATATYDPYGNTTATTGSATTLLGYDSQYANSDTGLIYLRARVYDPATAQFLSTDPFASLTHAPYNYAADDPLNYTDPAGREAIPIPVEVCATPETALACALGAGAAAILGQGAAESLVHSITGTEEAGDEGEAYEAAKREAECAPEGKIPTGSKPPDRAYSELARKAGLPIDRLKAALHRIKDGAGLKGPDDTRVDSDGNVYNSATGEWIGNLIDEAHG
jgi:RHS repeat-associated protein